MKLKEHQKPVFGYFWWYELSRRKGISEYTFRYEPIPHTGNNRYSGHYFRYPKTTNEKRQSYACDKKYIRAKRNSLTLVDAYDDLPRSQHKIKTWKYYRKTQYKVKDI